MKFKIQSSKFKVTNSLLFGILVLAAFLRLYRIQDYMTFLGDEGRDVLVAYNILHGHFTLLGPTASVGGFYFGPIYYYMMAPFLFLFNYNPVGPAVMVGLLGIATVWLVFILGRKFFTTSVGLLAAFLYAIAPVIIAYSRSSWNPNPVPFFSLLTVYFTYRGISENKQKFLLLAGIFLGIAIELHFIVLLLGAIVAIYLLLLRSHLAQGETLGKTLIVLIKQYAIVFLGFLIGWLPYLAFEVRHGFQNIQNFFHFVFLSGKVSSSNTNFFMTVGNVFFRFFGRLTTAFPPPEQLPKYTHPEIDFWYWGTIILGIASIILLGLQLYSAYRTKEKNRLLQLSFVAVWLFFGISFFGFYKKQIYDYYFSFMYPLPFLLIANLIVFLWYRTIVTKVLAGILFFILVYFNLQGVPFRYEPNRQLQQMQTISHFINSKTNGKPFNFALITGGNSDHAYRYFFTIWGHPPVTIENPVIDPQRKTVTDQLLIVCESIPCYPLGNSLFEIAGFGRAEIVGHWNVSVVEIYRLVHYKQK